MECSVCGQNSSNELPDRLIERLKELRLIHGVHKNLKTRLSELIADKQHAQHESNSENDVEYVQQLPQNIDRRLAPEENLTEFLEQVNIVKNSKEKLLHLKSSILEDMNDQIHTLSMVQSIE